MRKKIAFFVGEVAWAYQQTISEYIIEHANKLGYDVVVICSYGCYYESHFLYGEGEKACLHILDYSMYDGIIVAEDVFDIPGMADELYDNLKENATCPVVYLRSQRDGDGCYSILVENTISIANMVRHFTDVHGFTDICYMSGKEGMQDTAERLQGYLDVMKEKNIPVTEHMIFQGDYWRNKGAEAVDWFMTGRETYPQAIVCANDYMALSICEELRKRGVRIPEDVCVSGFDFIDEAKTYEPSLTSLEIDFKSMAMQAVDIIHQIQEGKKTDSIQRVSTNVKLFKSCGCGKQYQYKRVTDYLDAEHHHISDTKDIFLSSIDYQAAFEFNEYMNVADKYRGFIRSEQAYFCFLDAEEHGATEIENDSSFTNQMILQRIFKDDEPAKKLHYRFPRKDLLPEEYWSKDKPNNFFVFTIHYKNMVYGYMVASMPKKRWFDIYTQGFLMTLANAIENGQVHTQMAHLEEIRSLYQKDPLTGIFNRRGFDKLLQENIVSARMTGSNFGIVSIDMDNLKTINDTYGHSEGDNAIIILANALNGVMKPGEFCARIGGDEFSAFLQINTPNRSQEFQNEFRTTLKQMSADIEKYSVDASIGICELAEDPTASLISCIQTADMRMYDNKRARKQEIR